LQNTSKFNGLFRLFLFLTVFFISAQQAKAAYVIAALDYRATPAASVSKIGDTVYFTMTVIDATQTFSSLSAVTFTAGSTGNVYVGGTALPATPPTVGSPYYVYDGSHVWRVTAYTVFNSQITMVLNSSNMISGNSITDYSTLQYASFSASSGTMVTGGSATVSLGTAITGIQLFDNGNMAANNDLLANDGIYNAVFLVRETYNFELSNAFVVGRFTKLLSNAINAPFSAPRTITVDGRRPRLDLANVSPNPYNPDKELLQISYYLSENCTGTLAIYYNTVTIQSYSIEGFTGMNPPISWDGRSNTGSVQADGNFTYRFDLTDTAGNTGAAYTGVLKLTRVSLETEIITVDTKYTETAESQVLVALNVRHTLRNATTANLANLGFDQLIYGAGSYKLYPYIYTDLRIYDASGNLINTFPRDTSAGDEDYYYHLSTSNPPGYQVIDYTYNPLPIPACGTNSLTVYTAGDDNEGNDWNLAFGDVLSNAGGGIYTGNANFLFYSSQMSQGIYIAMAKGVLVGKTVVSYATDLATGSDTCTESGYSYIPYHAVPSFFVDEDAGIISDLRGYGLNSLDAFGRAATAGFIVEAPPSVPVPDGTAPRVITNSEYPSDKSVIQPSLIGPSNFVKITLTDDGVGAGTTNKSILTLYDPYGTIVPGTVSWNGGTPGTKNWEVYYIPSQAITTGGKYTITIIPVDANNNRGAETSYSFTVADQSIPVVTGVSVYPSTTNPPVSLSASTSTQVTFRVSRIEAVIISGGTAAVDWNTTTMTVETSAGGLVPGTLSHTSGSNILTFTPSGNMSDGNYIIRISATSENGYTGAYSYRFYISTAGTTYIDTSGVLTAPTANTYMILSVMDVNNSGIVDNAGVTVSPSAFGVAVVTGPANPSGYDAAGSHFQFSVNLPRVLPVSFNPAMVTSTIRFHLTASQVSTLSAGGILPSDITFWYHDGIQWNQISQASIAGPYTSGTDTYFEYSPVTGIPLNNVYGMFYIRPAVPIAQVKFNNTKAFNPKKGNAKIYTATSLTGIKNIRVYVYTLTGTLVKLSDYSKTSDTALFTGFDTDPMSGQVKYYYSFDGKNDKGNYLSNGLYNIKIETESTSGVKSTESRLIAVIK